MVRLKVLAWLKMQDLSRRTTKTTEWNVCPAKIQISPGIYPDWSVSSLYAWRKLWHWLPTERTAKTLIRLGGCPGWSESSLGAHVILLVLSCGGSFDKTKKAWTNHPFSTTMSKKIKPTRAKLSREIRNQNFKNLHFNASSVFFFVTTIHWAALWD